MSGHAVDEQTTRLYRIRKTVMEMSLRDRDNVVADYELTFTKEQFREKYADELKREDLVLHKPRRSNNAEHTFVFFPEEAKVGVKTIKTYVDRIELSSLCSRTSHPLPDNA